jgi:hypothetical protein
MRRNVLFATSVLLWAQAGWSGVYQTDASEEQCRADQDGIASFLASFAPREEERSLPPPRERVFGAPFRGALDKSIIDAATNLLDHPMGTELILEVNGTPYGFRLEPHYHPPGYEGGPIGWHKGVTVYEIEEHDPPGE